MHNQSEIHQMTMEFQATPQEVMRAVGMLEDYAEACDVPQKMIFGLALALEECGSNIVNHALKADARQKFRVTLACERHQVLLELRDQGLAFDPTAFNVKNQPASEDDEPGRWGIRLVRQYMDEIRYSRQGNENVLLLIKRINEPATKHRTF